MVTDCAGNHPRARRLMANVSGASRRWGSTTPVRRCCSSHPVHCRNDLVRRHCAAIRACGRFRAR